VRTIILFSLSCLLLISCQVDDEKREEDGIFLHVLGTVQDGGHPHIGCSKDCCENAFKGTQNKSHIVSLGLVNHTDQKNYLLEASPDMVMQMKTLKKLSSFSKSETPNGIILTHAHIGHYTGLMYLGKESMNSKSIPTYVLPKMKQFLSTNGPWDQLSTLKNISLKELAFDERKELDKNLSITPIQVPHRDEYSETSSFLIKGPKKSALFLPDIDKWEKWDHNLDSLLTKVDYAFLDATFFDEGELTERKMEDIPHPFIVETMELLKKSKNKDKIYFIHLNHTNPCLGPASKASQKVESNGFHIAREGMMFEL